MTNSGIFVVAGRTCKLAGTRTRRSFNPLKPGIVSLNDVAKARKSNRQTGYGRQGRGGRDAWVDKTVKIKKGPWKGYIGIVKSTTDKVLQVELHAKTKTVAVKREIVKQITREGHEAGGA